MSTPGGPDQPWEGEPPAYEQQPEWQPQYPPQQPPPQGDWQQYPPQQHYPPQQQYPPQHQQWEPGIYQQPPGPGQLPPDQNQWQQPYGGYQAAPTPPSNRTPLLVATAAFVVIALAIVGIVLLTNDDDDKNDAAPTPPPVSSAALPTPTSPAPSSSASSSQPTSGSPAPPGTTPTSVQQITVTPVIKGWHGVLSYKENVAYDVPRDWKVETPGTLVGFESNGGQPVAIMHGVSTYKDEACPGVSGSYRGRVGFRTSGDADPTSAAQSGLKAFADGVALKDNGKFAPISKTTLENIKVDGGKIDAKYARATVTLNDKSDCGSPSVVVVAVSFRTSPSTTAVFIGYFDQGVKDALSLSTAKKIFTTIRPYER